MPQDPPEPFNVPVSWVGWNETPIHFANAFLSQFQPDEFLLTIGSVSPPPVAGSAEELIEQAKEIPFVPVNTIARVGFTRRRLVELIQLLQANLENHDQAIKAMNPLDER